MTTKRTTSKEKLYRLIDRLPEGELHAACRYLEYLKEKGDPLMAALMNAPEEDEPISEEEEAAVQVARDELERGEYVTDEELRRELGI